MTPSLPSCPSHGLSVWDSPILAFLGALWTPTPYCMPVGQHDVTGTQLPDISVLFREALRTRRPKQKRTRMFPEDVRV